MALEQGAGGGGSSKKKTTSKALATALKRVSSSVPRTSVPTSTSKKTTKRVVPPPAPPSSTTKRKKSTRPKLPSKQIDVSSISYVPQAATSAPTYNTTSPSYAYDPGANATRQRTSDVGRNTNFRGRGNQADAAGRPLSGTEKRITPGGDRGANQPQFDSGLWNRMAQMFAGGQQVGATSSLDPTLMPQNPSAKRLGQIEQPTAGQQHAAEAQMARLLSAFTGRDVQPITQLPAPGVDTPTVRFTNDTGVNARPEPTISSLGPGIQSNNPIARVATAAVDMTKEYLQNTGVQENLRNRVLQRVMPPAIEAAQAIAGMGAVSPGVTYDGPGDGGPVEVQQGQIVGFPAAELFKRALVPALLGGADVADALTNEAFAVKTNIPVDDSFPVDLQGRQFTTGQMVNALFHSLETIAPWSKDFRDGSVNERFFAQLQGFNEVNDAYARMNEVQRTKAVSGLAMTGDPGRAMRYLEWLAYGPQLSANYRSQADAALAQGDMVTAARLGAWAEEIDKVDYNSAWWDAQNPWLYSIASIVSPLDLFNVAGWGLDAVKGSAKVLDRFATAFRAGGFAEEVTPEVAQGLARTAYWSAIVPGAATKDEAVAELTRQALDAASELQGKMGRELYDQWSGADTWFKKVMAETPAGAASRIAEQFTDITAMLFQPVRSTTEAKVLLEEFLDGNFIHAPDPLVSPTFRRDFGLLQMAKEDLLEVPSLDMRAPLDTNAIQGDLNLAADMAIRRLFGDIDADLPNATSYVRISDHPVEDGKKVVSFYNREHRVVHASGALDEDAARQMLNEAETQLSKIGERGPFEKATALARGLVSSTYMNLAPAFWMRNIYSAYASSLTDGVMSFKPTGDILREIRTLTGGFNPSGDLRSLERGEEAFKQLSNFWDFGGRWPAEKGNPMAWLNKKGHGVWAGATHLPGTNKTVPTGEQSMRGHIWYGGFRKAFDYELNTYVAEFGDELTNAGIAPEVTRQLSAAAYDIGRTLSKTELYQRLVGIATGTDEYFDLRAIGVRPEWLDPEDVSKIQEILGNHTTDTVDDMIGQLFDWANEASARHFDTLEKDPVQPGSWADTLQGLADDLGTFMDDINKSAEVLDDDGLRVIYGDAQEIVREIFEVETQSWDTIRDILANGRRRVDFQEALNYWVKLEDEKRLIRAESDKLSHQAAGVRDKALHAAIREKKKNLWLEYLDKSKAWRDETLTRMMEPTPEGGDTATNTMWDLLERASKFDYGSAVAAADEPMKAYEPEFLEEGQRIIDAMRSVIDNEMDRALLLFGRYPTMEHFDELIAANNDVTKTGRRARAFMDKMLEGVQDGDILYEDYLDQVDKLWNGFRRYAEMRIQFGSRSGLSASKAASIEPDVARRYGVTNDLVEWVMPGIPEDSDLYRIARMADVVSSEPLPAGPATGAAQDIIDEFSGTVEQQAWALGATDAPPNPAAGPAAVRQNVVDPEFEAAQQNAWALGATDAPQGVIDDNWLAQNADTYWNATAPEARTRIEELAAQRYTAAQIAQELGLTEEHVRAVRTKLGIPSQTIGGMGMTPQQPNPAFDEWLTGRGLATVDVSDAPIPGKKAVPAAPVPERFKPVTPDLYESANYRISQIEKAADFPIAMGDDVALTDGRRGIIEVIDGDNVQLYLEDGGGTVTVKADDVIENYGSGLADDVADVDMPAVEPARRPEPGSSGVTWKLTDKRSGEVIDEYKTVDLAKRAARDREKAAARQNYEAARAEQQAAQQTAQTAAVEPVEYSTADMRKIIKGAELNGTPIGVLQRLLEYVGLEETAAKLQGREYIDALDMLPQAARREIVKFIQGAPEEVAPPAPAVARATEEVVPERVFNSFAKVVRDNADDIGLSPEAVEGLADIVTMDEVLPLLNDSDRRALFYWLYRKAKEKGIEVADQWFDTTMPGMPNNLFGIEEGQDFFALLDGLRQSNKLSGSVVEVPTNGQFADAELDNIWHTVQNIAGNAMELLSRNDVLDVPLEQRPSVMGVIQNFMGKRDSALWNAIQSGDEAVRRTMINYNESTYADHYASQVMLYHFYQTRAVWNWSRRFWQDPRKAANVYRYYRGMAEENENMRDMGGPVRIDGTIPFPLRQLAENLGAPDWLSNALPNRLYDPLKYFFPLGLINEFHDPSAETTWFGKAWANARRYNLITNPVITAPVDAGLDVADRIMGGDPDQVPRAADYGLYNYLPWGRLINQGFKAMSGTIPPRYISHPYEYGVLNRQLMIRATRPELDEELSSYAMAYLENERYGLPQQPEIEARMEEIEAELQAASREVGQSGFARELLKQLTGMAWNDIPPEELSVRDAAEQYYALGYDEENEFGSRAAQDAYVDELSSAWGVDAETVLRLFQRYPEGYDRTPSEPSMAIRAIRDAYFDDVQPYFDAENEEIFDRLMSTGLTTDEMYAIRDKYRALREGVLEDYPTLKDMDEGQRSPLYTGGMNPYEEAQAKLYRYINLRMTDRPERPGDDEKDAMTWYDYYEDLGDWEYDLIEGVERMFDGMVKRAEKSGEAWETELLKGMTGRYAQEIIDTYEMRFDSAPEIVWEIDRAIEKEITAAGQLAINDRVIDQFGNDGYQLYFDWGKVKEGYSKEYGEDWYYDMPDDEREQYHEWMDQNPEIRSIKVFVEDPAAWTFIVDRWGEVVFEDNQNYPRASAGYSKADRNKFWREVGFEREKNLKAYWAWQKTYEQQAWTAFFDPDQAGEFTGYRGERPYPHPIYGEPGKYEPLGDVDREEFLTDYYEATLLDELRSTREGQSDIGKVLRALPRDVRGELMFPGVPGLTGPPATTPTQLPQFLAGTGRNDALRALGMDPTSDEGREYAGSVEEYIELEKERARIRDLMREGEKELTKADASGGGRSSWRRRRYYNNRTWRRGWRNYYGRRGWWRNYRSRWRNYYRGGGYGGGGGGYRSYGSYGRSSWRRDSNAQVNWRVFPRETDRNMMPDAGRIDPFFVRWIDRPRQGNYQQRPWARFERLT